MKLNLSTKAQRTASMLKVFAGFDTKQINEYLKLSSVRFTHTQKVDKTTYLVIA